MTSYRQDVLTSGFSKTLVLRQLAMMRSFENTDELYLQVERVRTTWENTGDKPENRRKLVYVDWLDPVKPFYVLVSEFSDHMLMGASMDLYVVKHHGTTWIGLPVPIRVIEELGGPGTVARMIGIAGLKGVLYAFKNIKRIDGLDAVIDELKEIVSEECERMGVYK